MQSFHIMHLQFLFQSSVKGDTVEILKKQLQEKEDQILQGKIATTLYVSVVRIGH